MKFLWMTSVSLWSVSVSVSVRAEHLDLLQGLSRMRTQLCVVQHNPGMCLLHKQVLLLMLHRHRSQLPDNSKLCPQASKL